ncbi:7-carboxy-7-deazaguanine synthase QueE [Pseudohongiella acticola]|jgi:7-carboxy-7-deazaguanine synthase|uniref:7-carboxy-7-deazaguanine synthase n=1 Tax=Pseudohongiella acticola TaxID=1524254 RepID=A0A1E8CGK6_9GAMM|nr:7-carboxy-7-deazaguanine synthase QueE [Pseudohongiella acticola]OFE11522.1 7-carboxy-7-deazaguanine synthase QueE [Pseudohongiella acticola]
MNKPLSLRINEIFFSLQGESSTVGLPTTFVRLTGCPLRCGYCDTEYAFHDGTVMPLTDILAQVEATGARYITVTGGEPLAQPGCLALLRELCDRGLRVSLETSGAMDIAEVDPRVTVVMDLKTPGSGECDRNLESNIGRLKRVDEVKFVICDRRDYEWSKAKIDQYDLGSRVQEILLSPSFEQLAYRDLAAWVLADRLPVRMQVQLHKIIWGDAPGH